MVRFMVFPCQSDRNESYLLEFEEEALFHLLVRSFKCDEMQLVECIEFNENGELVLLLDRPNKTRGYNSLRFLNEVDKRDEEIDKERAERTVVRRGSETTILQMQSFRAKEVRMPGGDIASKINRHIDNLYYAAAKRKSKIEEDSSQSQLSDLNFEGSNRESGPNDTKVDRSIG